MSDFGSGDDDFFFWKDSTIIDNDAKNKPRTQNNSKYDMEWFNRNVTLGDDIKEHILELLKTTDSPDLGEHLLDLLGYEQIDLVSNIMEHKDEIIQNTKKVAESKRPPPSNYPHIYGSANKTPTMLDTWNQWLSGTKPQMPPGTLHQNHATYEEFVFPPCVSSANQQQTTKVDLIPIKDQDKVIRKAYGHYACFNRMQSLVYPTAYHSNENLLVSAPTGAGKTDIALMTILRCVSQSPSSSKNAKNTVDSAPPFKAVYVAPMKALAAEIVEKFSKRLTPTFGLQVLEVTGDTQPPRHLLRSACLLVTTPEKWDVLTRQVVEDSYYLPSAVKLLILDEVHLLQDERGSVLEALIARTLRQVEQTQRMIRIVGLSATLPNYLDVAAVLRVNPWKAMFVFDGSFRPVPLTQSFLGIKGKTSREGGNPRLELLNQIAYERVLKYLRAKQQVMVFVHARLETVKACRAIIRLFGDNGYMNVLQEDLPALPTDLEFRRRLQRIQDRDLQDLIRLGFGCHHAGMSRSDRSLVEDLFGMGCIRVLCCTSTLAWGVNLPAHAVIIRGTAVYDQDRGGFRPLPVLDVLQIFGRAGRPQFDTTGEGILITSHNLLMHYIGAITAAVPIESRLGSRLPESLNAEIVLGNISSLADAESWLHYTFLHIRMRANPLAYGLTPKQLRADPDLTLHCRELLRSALIRLRNAGSAFIDDPNGLCRVKPSDSGRILSQYYLATETIERWVTYLTRHQTLDEADILQCFCLSSEFDAIRVTDAENLELEALAAEHCPLLPSEFDLSSAAGKMNVLLQGAWLSRRQVKEGSLLADLHYLFQNGGRLLRALFEWLRVNNNASNTAKNFLALGRAVPRALAILICFERRCWPVIHPLAQFGLLGLEVMDKIKAFKDVDALLKQLKGTNPLGLAPAELKAVKSLTEDFPRITIDSCIQPLSQDVLRVTVRVNIEHTWNTKMLLESQSSFPYYLFILNGGDEGRMLFSESFRVPKTPFASQPFVFHLEPSIKSIVVHVQSASILHCETKRRLEFASVKLPASDKPQFTIIPAKLGLKAFEALPFAILSTTGQTHLNAFQFYCYDLVMQQDSSLLICAPPGSSLNLLVEMAIWKTLNAKKSAKILRINSFNFMSKRKYSVQFDGDAVKHTTPSQSIQASHEEKLWDLIVLENIQYIAEDAIYEISSFICSKKAKRIIALSSCPLNNPSDLTKHLGVPICFNFGHEVRERPIRLRLEPISSNISLSARLSTMNRCIWDAFRTHQSNNLNNIDKNDFGKKMMIVFVPDRRDAFNTAQALLTMSMEHDGGNPNYFKRINRRGDKDGVNLLEGTFDFLNLGKYNDTLVNFLSHGLAILHDECRDEERQLCLNSESSVLISTFSMIHSLDDSIRADMVVIKGNERIEYTEDGSKTYAKDISVLDLHQMVGGFCNKQVLLLVSDVKRSYLSKIFSTGSFTMESKASFNEYLLLCRPESQEDTAKLISKHSFLGARVTANPAHYQQKLSAIDACVEQLVKTGFMTHPWAFTPLADVFKKYPELGIDAIASFAQNCIASLNSELGDKSILENKPLNRLFLLLAQNIRIMTRKIDPKLIPSDDPVIKKLYPEDHLVFQIYAGLLHNKLPKPSVEYVVNDVLHALLDVAVTKSDVRMVVDAIRAMQHFNPIKSSKLTTPKISVKDNREILITLPLTPSSITWYRIYYWIHLVNKIVFVNCQIIRNKTQSIRCEHDVAGVLVLPNVLSEAVASYFAPV